MGIPKTTEDRILPLISTNNDGDPNSDRGHKDGDNGDGKRRDSIHHAHNSRVDIRLETRRKTPRDRIRAAQPHNLI